MKIKNIIILFTIFVYQNNFAECKLLKDSDAEQILQLSEQKKSKEVLVSFDYTNENLINIINQLATYQGINILFPADSKKIDIEVTLNRPKKITLEAAWSIVNTFLEITGFSIVPKGITYEIVPKKDANKEPLPTYINIHPGQLPNNNSQIRYLYYLQNINLGSTSNKGRANIESILKDMLSGVPSTNNFTIDTKANCIIISNKTSNIKAVMNIIIALDKEGFREAIEIVPLKHTNANVITKILDEVIQSKSGSSGFGGYRPYGSGGINNSNSDDLYFAKNTSVVPIERSNSIAIMGKIDSVDKVKGFIVKYLDIPTINNKSIIHVRELQHLDANDLAKVLNQIIKKRTNSRQSSSKKDTLSEVIITAEQEGNVSQITQLDVKNQDKQSADNSKKKSTSIASSNNLIIAAREPEWRIIERLIDEIDKPQIQVAIEALIVDLVISDTGKISSQSRNLNLSGNPKSVNFQSAQMSSSGSANNGPALNFNSSTSESTNTYTPNSQGLASNLLTATTTGAAPDITNTLAGLVDAGSTLLSFDDGNGIASLLEIFKGYSNAKVLSQPFVTTTNHQQAAISLSTERIVAGTVKQQSVGGPSIIKKETIKADLKIDILPRISKSGNINLEILVNASEFKDESASNNTILARTVQTNANVSNKQVLVIGGLTKIKNTNTITGIPILSKIPILGNLFKSRKQTTDKSTLMIFISPKIIKPRRGISSFVKEKLDMIQLDIKNEELAFDGLSDPITRILFPAQANKTNTTINEFADKSIFDRSKNNGPISGSIK
jgi:general secretion pathway protein D